MFYNGVLFTELTTDRFQLLRYCECRN